MKQMQGIGQLLWKLREKEGIRQKQLCMGISSLSKYARIEADQQEIDFFRFKKSRAGKKYKGTTGRLSFSKKSGKHYRSRCDLCVRWKLSSGR